MTVSRVVPKWDLFLKWLKVEPWTLTLILKVKIIRNLVIMNLRNYEFDTFNGVVTFEPIDSMIIFFNRIQIGWSKKIKS